MMQIISRSKFDARTGFAGGSFLCIEFNDMFAIQPEAYYTMKGATYSESEAYEGFAYEPR